MIGKVVSLPQGTAEWATVRDKFGNNVTVHKDDLPKRAREGDEYAYRVDFSGNLPSFTLKPEDR